MRWTILTMLLSGCSAEDRSTGHLPPHPIGQGGAGELDAGDEPDAEPVDAGCDAWADEGCCATSTFCKEGSLGPCLVAVQLCEGQCTGTPTPVPNTKCGDGGMCSDGGCVAADDAGL